MSTHLKEAANQLTWWLRLPPTNLIDRGDHVRFRYALYLMIHQIATVLYGMNGLPETMHYPSRLEGARNRLNGLSRAPENAGVALWTLATERVPEKAWATASRLMRGTLALRNEPGGELGALEQGFEEGSFKPDQSRDPGELYALAAEIAERMRLLEGASAVALGGSLGRGFADRQSDIDLLVFGPGIPHEDERRRLIAAWPDIRHGPLIEPACDSVVLDGAMVHIRYWTRQTVEDMLAAFPGPPRPPEQRILAEELQCCHSLVDPDGRLGGWKAALDALPAELVKAVISEAQKRLPLFRNQWRKAQDADDRIHLYCLANQAVNDLLIALYMRNGRFLSTPRWTHKDTQAFDTLPVDLGTNLSRLVDGILDREDMVVRWTVLEGLWDKSEYLNTTVV
ncbi:MAG: nucleotidyltransferase domain-containing protein [Gemmatimonadetes bacterium]|nr:nucleotidyltransferase domain-containing protein [Gemmatimonadota bacterium]MYH17908.1 nucleotidyltransferase domain-containing protein [Gemmatimonadota bacterium]MYL00107.1 nucleotidyltransferase domain-containing protein [Gemmatimonadota bacterium]